MDDVFFAGNKQQKGIAGGVYFDFKYLDSFWIKHKLNRGSNVVTRTVINYTHKNNGIKKLESIGKFFKPPLDESDNNQSVDTYFDHKMQKSKRRILKEHKEAEEENDIKQDKVKKKKQKGDIKEQNGDIKEQKGDIKQQTDKEQHIVDDQAGPILSYDPCYQKTGIILSLTQAFNS